MSPDRPRHGRVRRLLLALAPLLAVSLPPPAEADIYTWVDDRGVQNFVDDPAAIPNRFRGRARLLIVSSPSPLRTPPAPLEEPARSEPVEGPGRREEQTPVTQGALAVALAERLGLAARPTPLQAAIALLERGISPPAGWILDDPVEPRVIAELARSLLDAGAGGTIPQEPETALRVLEAVAAEVGVALVTVPVAAEPPPSAVGDVPQVVVVERVVVPFFPHHGTRFLRHPHPRTGLAKNLPRSQRGSGAREGGRHCQSGSSMSLDSGPGHANRIRFHHALDHRSAWQHDRAAMAAASCKEAVR